MGLRYILIGLFFFTFTVFIVSQLAWAQNTPILSNFLNYTNSTYGVSIQYPASWSIEGGSSKPSDTIISVASINPPILIDPHVSTDFTIYVDTRPPSINLNQYLRDTINFYRTGNESKPSFQIIEANANSFIAGKPFFSLIYYWDRQGIGPTESIDMGMVAGNRIYYITFDTEPPKYQELIPTVMRMIKSFEVIMPHQH